MTNTLESSDNNKERLLCNSCDGFTWHQSLFEQLIAHPHYAYIQGELEPVDEFSEKWQVFQCLGCNNVTIRVITHYPWIEEENEQYEFYPERTGGHHLEKEYQNLPKNLKKLYSEVVTAFNRKILLLCAAGLRALLEGLCHDQRIIKGPNAQGKIRKNLEGKINGLTSIVPAGIVKNLHSLRFLGNQALHELEIPSEDDLELALMVVEDILNVVYDLNSRSQLLYDKVGTKPTKPETSEDNNPF